MLWTSGEQADNRLEALEALVQKKPSLSPGDGEMLAPGRLIQGGLPPWIVQRIRAFIDDNIEQRITIDGAGKACEFVSLVFRSGIQTVNGDTTI